MAPSVKALVISASVILFILYIVLFLKEVGPSNPISTTGSIAPSTEVPPNEKEEKPSVEEVGPPPSWLINNPQYFYDRSYDGAMLDVRDDPVQMAEFERLATDYVWNLATDYEVVDALEQYFWGQRNGLCIELGATGGGLDTHSQTYDYEQRFGWRRILVEGNPNMKKPLLESSPLAFVASTAVCKDETTLHYLNYGLVSGIVEFMTPKFISAFYPELHNSMVPPGNLSSVDWPKVANSEPIDCAPMSKILRQAKTTHVNYFILDTEGAELQILETVDFDRVTFDVICIEVDPPYRPDGYADKVVRFMHSKGYINYSGLIGRNLWFIRSDFVPYQRPGLKDICYRRACPRP